MTSTHKVPKKIIAVLAIIFLLPALYIFGIWINVFSQDINDVQKISQFTDSFPSIISDYKLVIAISMAFCIAAMIFAAKSFKQPFLPLRVAMWFTVIISSLIFFLDVFQLL